MYLKSKEIVGIAIPEKYCKDAGAGDKPCKGSAVPGGQGLLGRWHRAMCCESPWFLFGGSLYGWAKFEEHRPIFP